MPFKSVGIVRFIENYRYYRKMGFYPRSAWYLAGLRKLPH